MCDLTSLRRECGWIHSRAYTGSDVVLRSTPSQSPPREGGRAQPCPTGAGHEPVFRTKGEKVIEEQGEEQRMNAGKDTPHPAPAPAVGDLSPGSLLRRVWHKQGPADGYVRDHVPC